MKQYIHNTKDTLYIAGPACFYQDGYELWHALRGKAEYLGYRVTMPTRVQLKLDHEDARKNADEIFANCVRAMGAANVLIADLEAFRGTEPDGGTVFEMGMAYALHHRIYAYTRDKRPLIHKLGTAQLMENTVVDLQGQPLPYGELPFCLCVMGCAKVFEGSFENALQLVAIDEEQAMVQRAWNKEPLSLPKTEAASPERVFLFSPRFFAPDGEAWVLLQKHALERDGFTVVTPYDPADGEPSTPPTTIMEKHLRLFGRWVRHVKSCGTLAVDLNDMNGYEPSGDATFLAGMAWQLGRRCRGFMADTRPMRLRIPHYGPEENHLDIFGSAVENFDYPINLMLASAMPIFEGEPATLPSQWID